MNVEIEQMWRTSKNTLERKAAAIVQNTAEAQDVVSEVFLYGLERIQAGTLDPTPIPKLSRWMKVTVRWRAVSRLQRRAEIGRYNDDCVAVDAVAPNTIDTMLRKRVKEIIQLLDPLDAELLHSIVAGVTRAEAVNVLGLTTAQYNVARRRAIDEFRNAWTTRFGDNNISRQLMHSALSET